MSITVVHDGTGENDVRERCAFCRAKTRYWFAPKDVAVCLACSEIKNARDVPTKRDWCAAERLRNEGAATACLTSALIRADRAPEVTQEK